MNWNEDEHLSFYSGLKALDPAERSHATLDRARDLLQKARSADELKIESVLTYWKLNLNFTEHLDRANTLFYHLYQRMGEPNKAQKFLHKDH